MYICTKCGEIYEDIPLKVTKYSSRSYDNYSPDDVSEIGCDCGGKIVKAEKCALCGEYFPRKTLNTEICDDCLDVEAEAHGYEYALKIGNNNERAVYVNGLIEALLTPEEINKILLNHIEANKDNIKRFNAKCEHFCLEDRYCFSEYVIEGKINDDK